MWMSPFTFKDITWPSHKHAILAIKKKILTGAPLSDMADTINSYAKGTWAKATTSLEFEAIWDHDPWHNSRQETVHIILIHATLTDHQVLRCILDPRIHNFQHTLPHLNPNCFWSSQNNNHGLLLQSIHHELIDFASY